MTDYTKLVAALRKVADYINCYDCDMWGLNECDTERKSCVLRNAADAIEALQAEVKKAAHRNAELHAELEKWVSAAEGLQDEVEILKVSGREAYFEGLTVRNFPAASPWHRVEDGLPPKATWVLTVATDGNVKLFNIATVDAGGQWWTCSPQNILRELYGVRYWMPIEPPEEDKG